MILGLFFTKNVSLETWVKSGLIDREKAIYEYHLRNGDLQNVYWFTYGGNDYKYYKDLIQCGKLDSRIIVVPPPKLFAKRVWRHCYWLVLPWIHHKICRKLDVVKSNQCPGALVPWLVGRIYRIPFYFRTGYTDSSFYTMLHNEKQDYRYHIIRSKEKFLYRQCAIAAVSSVHDKEYVCKEYDISQAKVMLVRNFIDIDKFKKTTKIQSRLDKIIFIGRLNPQKNLHTLFYAVKELGIAVDIYGTGDLKKTLEVLAKELKIDVQFKGSITNSQIPTILNQYKYYALVSLGEGMPKALLEAMACGCICIGTPVEGITEVIQDEKNGFLANGITTSDIIEAVQRACNFEAQEKIANNACELIRKDYSLKEIATIDKKNIFKICGK